MPYTFLNINAEKRSFITDTEELLYAELPAIIAEELSVEGAPIHEGGLTPNEIMVWPVMSDQTVNGKDVEILIFIHPFDARLFNIEERKDAIIARIQRRGTEEHMHFTFAICIILAPMAYGTGRVINPMP